MADNKTLPATGTGTADIVVATDEIAGVDYQFVKLVDGTLDSTTKIVAANGAASGALRVTVANDSTGIIALTTSTASIGKLAANSGIDIGDVDVTSIIPGTGATNLGKAIDGTAGATDTGVAVLAIRDDALATLTPPDGDYTALRTNNKGGLWTATALGTPVTADDATSNSNLLAPYDSTGGVTGGLLVAPLVWDAGASLWKRLTLAPEDVAETAGGLLFPMGTVRRDTEASSAGTTGDNATLNTDAGGGLWVSGPRTIRITVTPTITAAGIYASGDAVGGLLTFSNAVRISGSGGVVMGLTIVDMDQELAPLELVLFNQTFTNTADNSPFDPTDSDLANVIGVIACGPYSSFNDNSVSTRMGIGLPYVLTGTDLFGQLVVRSTPTYTATSDIQVKLLLMPD